MNESQKAIAEAEKTIKAAKRKAYVASQPWVQDLIELHRIPYDGPCWAITEGGLYGTVYLGYIDSDYLGIDWKNWATAVDSDSWVIDRIVFKRRVGDISLQLNVRAYVKYDPSEIALLDACGKVHWSEPQAPQMSIYCER